jgi:hypothetical protein
MFVSHRICRIATFFTGYAEFLHSSQDIQNFYILHRIYRIASNFTYAEMLRTFFTGYAELPSVYEEVPVMYSPQDVQDTELQLSSAENRRGAFGHSYPPRKSVHRRGSHCTRK